MFRQSVVVAAETQQRMSLCQQTDACTSDLQCNWLIGVIMQHARTCQDLHVGDWSRLLVTHYGPVKQGYTGSYGLKTKVIKSQIKDSYESHQDRTQYIIKSHHITQLLRYSNNFYCIAMRRLYIVVSYAYNIITIIYF